MNITVEPGMTLDMSSGCVVILGGSTAERRKGEEGGEMEMRRVIVASERMDTRSH